MLRNRSSSTWKCCALLIGLTLSFHWAAANAGPQAAGQPKKQYYAIMSLEIFPGKHAEFVRLLQKDIPELEKVGIRLVNSYTITIGALYKVVDVWVCDDPGTMYKAFMSSGSWDEDSYSTIVKSETAEFAEATF